MNKTEAKRIAHAIACSQIRNFIDMGACFGRWTDADAAKVNEALGQLATSHDVFAAGAVIPHEDPGAAPGQGGVKEKP